MPRKVFHITQMPLDFVILALLWRVLYFIVHYCGIFMLALVKTSVCVCVCGMYMCGVYVLLCICLSMRVYVYISLSMCVKWSKVNVLISFFWNFSTFLNIFWLLLILSLIFFDVLLSFSTCFWNLFITCPYKLKVFGWWWWWVVVDCVCVCISIWRIL